jgi:hypothetical protein
VNVAVALWTHKALAFFAVAIGIAVRGSRSGTSAAAALTGALFVLAYFGNDVLFLLDARDGLLLLCAGILILSVVMRSSAGWFLSGLLAVLSFFYYLDRAVFFLIASIGLLLLQACFEPGRRVLARTAGSYVAGVVSGSLVFVALVGFDEIRSFLTTALFWVRYRDFLDAFIYPAPLSASWQYSDGMVLIAVLLLGFVVEYPRYQRRGDLAGAAVHLLFALLALVYYRAALGRSDLPHLIYAKGFAYLGAVHLAWLVGGKMVFVRRWAPIAVIAVLVYVAAQPILTVTRLRTQLPGAGERLGRLITREGEAFMDERSAAILPRMKAAFGRQPCTFMFPNTPNWYYFLRQRPCTRFYITWFAAPETHQRQLIRDLERWRPSVILFEMPDWQNAPDGISNAERLPLVASYIRQHYRETENIEGYRIYSLSR